MLALGLGLFSAHDYASARTTLEALLHANVRLGVDEREILDVQTNLMFCYDRLGREEEALPLRQHIYNRTKLLCGPSHENTMIDAVSLATSLSKLNHHAACQTLALEVMPICQKSFGPAHRYTLELRATYARSLICGIGLLYEEGEERAAFYKILSQLHRAEQILETDLGLASRAFGATHKRTEDTKSRLKVVRESITDWIKLFSRPRK